MKSGFKCLDHVSKREEISKFITFPWMKETQFYFKQIALNFSFSFTIIINYFWSKIFSVVDGGVILFSDIPFDCHEPILPFLDAK